MQTMPNDLDWNDMCLSCLESSSSGKLSIYQQMVKKIEKSMGIARIEEES